MSAPNSTITLHPEMHREIDDSLQTSRLTRSAMLSVVAVSSARNSSSQRRPRAIDATKVARFSERIGRACCGDIPSGRRIAVFHLGITTKSDFVFTRPRPMSEVERPCIFNIIVRWRLRRIRARRGSAAARWRRLNKIFQEGAAKILAKK